MKSVYTIVKKPLFTEKGTALKEAQNKVMVEVSVDANKLDIKRAIEEIFKVKVEKVATVSERGKLKTYGKFKGMTPTRKKAIITLKKGEKLDFIEGA
jgi:large subunit ribosomal protein L23